MLPKVKMSYAVIVPDDLQNELMSIGQMSMIGMFRIGEIANILIKNLPNYASEVTREDIYSAVGAYSGKASRTVRDYATIEAFFPPDVVAHYDILYFDHFRFAARFPDMWKEILDYAVSKVDELGRPATVDDLVAHFTFPDMWGERESDEEEAEDLDPFQTRLSNCKKGIQRLRDMLNNFKELRTRNRILSLLDEAEQLLER